MSEISLCSILDSVEVLLLLAWRKYASCLYAPFLSRDGTMSRFAAPFSPFLLFLLLSKLVICVPADHAAVEHVHWQRDETSTTTRGWVTSPNGRGTLDIIWSCILTISLCSWSTLCLNLPAAGDSYFRIVRRKIYMTGLGILGPEIILQLALGQWASARRSVELFHASGYTSWTMTHAFFADMGGFILQPKDSTSFPLTALQLHYLVKEGFLKCPDVDKKTLQDKDKGEAFVRVITIIQICWFLLNCIGRGAQRLAITTFELTTIAFIVCSLATSYFWLRKPMDVETPFILTSEITITEIHARDGELAREPWDRTPLDFVEGRRGWSWNIYWHHCLEFCRWIGIRFGPQRRPISRIPNDNFPEPSAVGMMILCVFHLAYAGIHLGGWNFHFPSNAEKILWRWSTASTAASIIGTWLVEAYAFRALPARSKNLPRRFITAKRGRVRTTYHSAWIGSQCPEQQSGTIAGRIRNFWGKDCVWELPLRVLFPVGFFGFIYTISRCYILAEDVVTLRELPASAFRTVDWSAVLPHF